MKGFSPRNLKYMRRFAEVFPDATIVPQAVAQIPWGHIRAILDKVPELSAREYYIRKTIEHGWSRNILALQIDGRLYEREGQAITNFPATLPPSQSDLARATLKDPYLFDFLALGEEAAERDLERGLLDHLRAFLLELGVGFAFVGSQYHLEVAGDDFFIDLLFYHLRLRCFVVIDLKMGEFRPEYAGKMSFYLSAVDALLRHPDDRASIGLVLCRTQNRVIAEYTLRDIHKPMGVATFTFADALPEEIRGDVPTIEEIETHLGE